MERVFLYSSIGVLVVFIVCVCYCGRASLCAPCCACVYCGRRSKKVAHHVVEEDAELAKRRKQQAAKRSSLVPAANMKRSGNQAESDQFRPVNKRHVPFTWESASAGEANSEEVLRGEAMVLFQVIDENQKGSISQQELLEFLPRYGLGSEEIETMFTEADANKDGLLDREEFETGLFPKLKAREMGGGGGGGKKGGREAEEAEAKLLFDSFDENKNGTLDSMELHRGLAHAGLTEEEIDTILHVAEGNQALTFEDFKRGILPHLRGQADQEEQSKPKSTVPSITQDLMDKYDIDMRQVKYKPAPKIPIRQPPALIADPEQPPPKSSRGRPPQLPPLNLPGGATPRKQKEEEVAEREGVGSTESADKDQEDEAADRLQRLKEKAEGGPARPSKQDLDQGQYKFVVFEGGDESIAEIRLPETATWSEMQVQLKAKTKSAGLYGLRFLDPKDPDKPKMVRNEEEWRACMQCCMSEADRELEVDKVQPTTKVYKLDLKVAKAEKKRIYYQNLYDHPVTWSLDADNPLVSFKDPQLTVPQQEKGAIVLKFKAVPEAKTETIVVRLKEDSTEIVHNVRVQASWS